MTCCYEQGERECYGRDLARGMENIPILLAETPSMHGLSSFDKCYNYVCSPVLHESVTVEALASARALDVFCLCVSEVNCCDNCTDSSCVHVNGTIAYSADGVLLPRYITQVKRNLYLYYLYV